jgi:hypothetical protein
MDKYLTEIAKSNKRMRISTRLFLIISILRLICMFWLEYN